jgi:hypothetical protein
MEIFSTKIKFGPGFFENLVKRRPTFTFRSQATVFLKNSGNSIHPNVFFTQHLQSIK